MARREGYRFGVAWIAENDDNGSPDALDQNAVSGYISVGLLADLFRKETDTVARDVVAYRKQHASEP